MRIEMIRIIFNLMFIKDMVLQIQYIIFEAYYNCLPQQTIVLKSNIKY